MRFKSIKYKNYRCFLNGEIVFDDNNEKNISLVIGANGAGKTEMLFSFWWVLYGYEFTKLSGKEATPYALNSDKYKRLEMNNDGERDKCYIVVEFEDKGTVYRLKREVMYFKHAVRITTTEKVELSHYDKNGALSLPEKDNDKINIVLNSIIPKSILYGIIFDGERMQKLSSIDDQSRKAVNGVINDVTNTELIDGCIGNYTKINRSLNSTLRNLAKNNSDVELEEIADSIDELEDYIKDLSNTVNGEEREMGELEETIIQLKTEIGQYDEAKKIQNDIKQNKERRNKEEELITTNYKNFAASLKDAYLLNSDKLFSDIGDIITNCKVPLGLTVPAVDSILEGDYCICGNKLNQEERDALLELRKQLPPNNINATLEDEILGLKENKDKTQTDCNNFSERILQSEKKVLELKKTISDLSNQIINGSEEKASKLEDKLLNDIRKMGTVEEKYRTDSNLLNDKKSELDNLVASRGEKAKRSNKMSEVSNMQKFVDKALKALESIKERNNEIALCEINDHLQKAYLELSEDADYGRKIHIIQHLSSNKYEIVVYLETNYDERMSDWVEDGLYDEYKNEKGLSDDEIVEKCILECKDSNSTGQSKINTLSFVKAILDYSNNIKDDDEILQKKEYPLIIDAPFGDIFDNNLVKSSKALHTFANQIILMLSEESYDGVKEYVQQYVSGICRFSKQDGANYSVIESREEFV